MAVTKGSPRVRKEPSAFETEKHVGDYEFGNSPSIRGAGSIGGRGDRGAMKFEGGASQGRQAKTSKMSKSDDSD